MAPMLARLIAARLPERDRERWIIPVPLHRWRLWNRGYNQSAGARIGEAGAWPVGGRGS